MSESEPARDTSIPKGRFVPPDRPIYRRQDAVGYLRSLFVHSLDESKAFWEKDKKAIVSDSCFLALGALIWFLVRGWDYTLNEILLGAAITVGAPIGAAVLMYLWGVLKAPVSLNRQKLARIEEMGLAERRLRDSSSQALALLTNRQAEELARHRSAGLSTPMPDVMLRLDVTRKSNLSDEDAPITVYNAQDMAMHIEIDPVDTGEYQIGAKFGADGKPVAPLAASTTMVFSQVPDLAAAQSAETRLSLDSASVQFAMMTALKQDIGLWWFIEHLYNHKWYDEQRYGSVTDANRDGAEAAVRRMPLEIPLRLTYWNRSQTTQWERTEVLHYEPAKKRAYITHGKPFDLTAAMPANRQRSLDGVGHALFVNKTKRLIEWCELQQRFITLGVAYSPTSADAQTFANQVASACKDAGFRIRGVVALSLHEVKNYPGIWVLKEKSWGAAQDPPIEEALRNAFKDSGYKANVDWAGNYPGATFQIIVGD